MNEPSENNLHGKGPFFTELEDLILKWSGSSDSIGDYGAADGEISFIFENSKSNNNPESSKNSITFCFCRAYLRLLPFDYEIELNNDAVAEEVRKYYDLMSLACNILLRMESIEACEGNLKLPNNIYHQIENVYSDIEKNNIPDIRNFVIDKKIEKIIELVAPLAPEVEAKLPPNVHQAYPEMQELFKRQREENRKRLTESEAIKALKTELTKYDVEWIAFLANYRLYFKQLIDENVFGICALIAGGIVAAHYAQYQEKRGFYLSAFIAKMKAITLWQKANYSVGNRDFTYFINTIDWCLPFYNNWEAQEDFDEPQNNWEIQKIVTLWEKAKKLPIGYGEWNSINESLHNLARLAYEKGWEDTKIFSADGKSYDIDEYFKRQDGFCEEVLARQRSILTSLKQRLGPELWAQLPTKAENYLIDIENCWMDNRPDLAAIETRSLLEITLIDVFDFLKSFQERQDNHLMITRFRYALKGEPGYSVQGFVAGLKISEADKLWITGTLPRFLKEIADVRNYFDKDKPKTTITVHEEAEWLDEARIIHQKLVESADAGVLIKLLEIKRAISRAN